MDVSKSKHLSGKASLFGRFGLVLAAFLFSLSVAACSGDAPGRNNPTLVGASPAVASTTTEAAATVPTITQPVSPTPITAATTSPAVANAAPTAEPTSPSKVSLPVAQSSPAAFSADQVESNTVVGVVKQVSPAVVTVYNKAKISTSRPNGNRPGGSSPTPTPGSGQVNPGTDGLRTQGIGSGAIISDQGYIITNAHVVEGEQGLTVAFNNGKKVVAAKVVGVDTTGDIAVIKIDGPVPAVARFGDSGKVQIGETVLAIGSALGDFRNSVTKGVISGINRTLDHTPSVYLQTDAPINHGNSGGPLVNLQGEIIGINTAVLRSTPGIGGMSGDVAEALGFAIPSNTAKFLSDQLISKGSVTRPYFGITYQMITPALAGSTYAGLNIPAVEGAWIQGSRNNNGVVSGGPADKAGLKDNDVITGIEGVPLNDNNPLVSVIQGFKPGQTIKLGIQRGTETLEISLTLGERPKDLP